MCSPCLYTADPRIWALHKRMDCGCADLTTFNKVLTDMSLFFIYFRWTTSSWAPLTLLCCVWPQAPLKVLQWTQALLCRSTLLKCPADLCSQIFIRWNQLMDSLCPKHASGLYVHLLPTGVWLQILLCLTASDGHSLPLYCHHWGEAPNETAHILWLRSDRGRCVVVSLWCAV